MSALGWDEGRVYHAHVLQGEDQSPDAPAKLEQQFFDFILEFRLDNSYIYRYGAPCTSLIASDQLQTNIVAKRYFLDVNVEHLIMANEHLADKLKNEPAAMLPLVYSEDIVLMRSLRMQ
jgi:DNA replication licensing factor MCM5